MKEEEERTPLRTILQNFLNHIEKLDKEKLEGSYDKEFQELKLFSEFLKTSKQYSCSQGEKEVNRKKNRYKDILPFDCSRVILEDYAGIPGSDYINANYIKGASGSPAYIASQGPLPHTVNDFWRMVVQCEVQVIVMACNEEESGKHKCENYWVEHEGEEKQFGMVAIQLIKASVVCPDFLVRTMRLKYTKNHSSAQEERTVCQFHYSAWPDHGVPPLVRPLLDMVRLVRDTQASETLPVLVHCSAGCGRTGTICAIDYVWGLLRAGKLTKDFSLFKLVREMRKQRIAMVQTKEQYVLVHHAVKELFNEQLRMIDSHPYENIDVNGMVKESPEPVYATIMCEGSNEEKQDSNEKECVSQESDDAPPLPCKRKPYTAHTKQEKEVENLTEKQRCSVSEQQIAVNECSSPGTSSSNSSTCGSLLHKPRIAKLRALFERTSSRESKSTQVKQRTPQQVTRSHSLGAVRKVEGGVTCVQPIPNRGILRVPQLTVSSGATYVRTERPALPIKRSKSLKVLSSGECSKFSVPVTHKGSSQECQYNDCSSVEVVEFKSIPRVYSHSGSESVVNEVKPYVPPKKVTKDRVSDKKGLKSISDGNKNFNSQSFVHNSIKDSEDLQLKNAFFSTTDRRRSLDSLTIESDGIVSEEQSSSGKFVSPSESECYKLDEEAQKLLQDCRDYLTASAKCNNSRTTASVEKKFLDSPVMNFDSLQHLTVEAQRKVNAVVGGLGTRERRNSFRQAISKELESGVSSQEYETHWLNKAVPGPPNNSNTKAVSCSMSGKPLSVAAHMKILQKPSVEGCSDHTRIVPMRAYRPKARNGPKVELQPGTHYIADSPTLPKASVRAESQNAGYPSHIELSNYDHQYVSRGTEQLNENVFVKEKIESISAARHDAVHLQHVPHNSCHSGSTKCPSDSQNEKKITSNVSPMVNHEICDYKNVSVSVARRVNTNGKGRFVTLNTSTTNHFDQQSVNENEVSVMARTTHSEMSRSHQGPTIHSETRRLLGVANEQISVNPEASNIIRNFRCTESHKIHSKDVDHSLSMKHDVASCSGKCKDWSEKSSVGVGITSLRQPEWIGRMTVGTSHIRPVAKKNWPISSSIAHNQEQAHHGADGERNTVKSRDVSGIETEASRDQIIGGRCMASGKVVPKTVKQKKETLGSEGVLRAPHHHGSEDDLALCATGAGSAASSGVRRHASVMLLRHSLIETNDSAPLAPLAVWNAPQPESGDHRTATAANRQNVTRHDLEAWNGAPGVDVDMVGASIKPSRDHGTPFTRALEAFHLRKPSRGVAVSPSQQRKFAQTQVFIKKQHYL